MALLNHWRQGAPGKKGGHSGEACRIDHTERKIDKVNTNLNTICFITKKSFFSSAVENFFRPTNKNSNSRNV
ncbi:MAG: hypothetical protein RI826_06770 [Chlorobium phaeovibrioides]|nr:hypothetical protein [Chlorobium phaeovibrioides]